MPHKLVAEEPVPIWLLLVDEAEGTLPSLAAQRSILDLTVEAGLVGCDFRGIAHERLGTALKTGVDVDPTDRTIWVFTMEKAWEYSAFPKAILAFSPDHLDRTFRRVAPGTPDETVAAIRETFPTGVAPFAWTPDSGGDPGGRRPVWVVQRSTRPSSVVRRSLW